MGIWGQFTKYFLRRVIAVVQENIARMKESMGTDSNGSYHLTAIAGTTTPVPYNSCLWISLDCRLLVSHYNHIECDGVSSRQPHDCFLNRLFRRRSKKTSKLRVTDLCEGNSPVTGEFPAQRASNAENVSMWWRHHFQSTATQSSMNSLIWLNDNGISIGAPVTAINAISMA